MTHRAATLSPVTTARTSTPPPARRPRARRATPAVHRAFFALLLLTLSLAAAGCPCVNSIVNASPGLRWWLFSTYGAERVCPEMMKTSLPLSLQNGSASIGRFFPKTCSHQVNEQGETLIVHVQGDGYAYLPTAKRVGFSMTVSVEYRPDFRIEGDDLYLWGRLQRVAAGPDFRIQFVENPVVDMATSMTPMGSAATFLGTQVVNSFLARGFTVVHNEDRGNEFSLGILMPPARPFRPFQVDDDDAYTFANETLDLHTGQRDFLGPFEITDKDQQLSLRFNVTGTPIEAMVVPKPLGDLWRDAHQRTGATGGPPGQPLMGIPIQPGMMNRKLKLAPGLYYVVLDNTSTAGFVNPPVNLNPLFDPAVRVSYVAQLVE